MNGKALIVLAGVIISLAAWAGNRIIGTEQRVIRLEEREKSHKEILIEIRSDVKEIRRVIR